MTRIFVVGVVAGCGGAAGDWEATALEVGGASHPVVGILEVDRDGEALLDLRVAGEAVNGTLRGRGRGDVAGQEAALTLVATWASEGVAAQVPVDAACSRVDAVLTCDADVGGDAWRLTFGREPALD